ncbi:MAG: DUF3795 domain-containing protein [Desulfobacteraceae bacterium]|nr:MAG: DUF3795 domain-containing protein [Desulfobacteraceae bacterium]
MKTIKADTKLIAACGLYCGGCHAYLKKRCPGCRENAKAAKWCKPRTCCLDHKYGSCADCKQYDRVMECRDYNNFIAKIFGFIFRSNRKACIDMIKAKGPAAFAEHMAEQGLRTLKR